MKQKRWTSLAIALVMAAGLLAGCSGEKAGPSASPAGPDTPQPSQSAGGAIAAGDLKVALILNGSITDASWNANGYNGLKANADELGFEWTYIENVQAADMEATIRDFCEQGYNLIMAHGSQFDDAMTAVAAGYPDIKFFVYNGEVSGDNLASIRNASDENAFIAGAIAALASKSGTIGWIGAVEVPTTSDVLYGYEAGAKYARADINVLSAYVGSYNDTAKAKELALTMFEQGADVIQSNANQGSAGIIEATYEQGTDSGLMLIGNTRDQYDDAPEFMLTSCVIDFPAAFRIPIDQVMAGTFTGGITMGTVANGVMSYAPYHDKADALSSEDKAFVEQLVADMSAGKLNAQLPCDYSAFGRPNE
ncbi:BMP family ABC transporter substrate-binding protein [Pseudoflavonifractor sp. 524-17]|uniref:BMP family protein n=1 Tax=Pseudoflavonifractor sp. 524-17 TaxID=2304577 RepID=UPI00137B90BB|nr:BMP family protein [Pseudoflavonifractor sp. 524-17]NCE63205.1 BMP family ABC transporter substrate-binding protein [Pseudoflavonifractor sp. 524-17]